MMLYTTIRDNPQEFDRAASTQASATLASAKGRVADMGRYSTGNPELEKTAFSLQPGEVSRVIGVPEGLLVLKCLGRVPAKNTPLEEVRAALEREVIERKTVLEIPRFAAELQKTAKVVKILKNYEDNSQVIRDVQQEIEEVSKDGKPKGSK
jgi:hypothetical protein